jgi:hypothetical protein
MGTGAFRQGGIGGYPELAGGGEGMRKNLDAQEDLEEYWAAMKIGDIPAALEIERRYGLDGYPPSIVTVGMKALAEGRNMGKAIDKAMGM